MGNGVFSVATPQLDNLDWFITAIMSTLKLKAIYTLYLSFWVRDGV